MLCLAFFIYWIFNPSWASRLWYNIRTFPQRVTSWISDKSFLDYDSYKLDLKDVWDEIEESVTKHLDDEEDENVVDDELTDDGEILDVKEDDSVDENKDKNSNKNNDKDNNGKDKKNSKSKNTIKSFPKSIRFVEMPGVNGISWSKEDVSSFWYWYSKSDILSIVSEYIEDNLDENTNILVTVEYEEDSSNPERIILRTWSKNEKSNRQILLSSDSYTNSENSSYGLNSENIVLSFDEKDDLEQENDEGIVSNDDKKVNDESSVKKTTSSQKATSSKKTTSSKKVDSNKLSPEEQKEAEELFWMLF